MDLIEWIAIISMVLNFVVALPLFLSFKSVLLRLKLLVLRNKGYCSVIKLSEHRSFCYDLAKPGKEFGNEILVGKDKMFVFNSDEIGYDQLNNCPGIILDEKTASVISPGDSKKGLSAKSLRVLIQRAKSLGKYEAELPDKKEAIMYAVMGFFVGLIISYIAIKNFGV